PSRIPAGEQQSLGNEDRSLGRGAGSVREPRPTRYVWSEYKFQAELNDARTTFAEPRIPGSNIRCFTDCSERGAVEIDVRKTEIRSVEGIDDFSSKLHRRVLCHFCQLIHRQIDGMQIRADDYVPTRISERAGLRPLKCCFVEPLVRQVWTGIGIADKIRPIIQFARAAGVHAQEGCDRETALARVDPTQLPAFC